MLHQIPDLQPISARNPGHRIQPHILPAPLHHLVVLVVHTAQYRRLLLRQAVPLTQLPESLSEKFSGGEVIGHPRKLCIFLSPEHRSIKYCCIARNQ